MKINVTCHCTVLWSVPLYRLTLPVLTEIVNSGFHHSPFSFVETDRSEAGRKLSDTLLLRLYEGVHVREREIDLLTVSRVLPCVC